MKPISASLTCLLLVATPSLGQPDLSRRLPGRVRAGYMAPGNIKLVPRMQEVGMNAALVKFGSLRPTLSPGQCSQMVRWADEGAILGISFLPVINLFGGYEPKWVRDFVRYVDPRGIEYLRTPCFADGDFWAKTVTARFTAISTALRGKNLGGICLDVEMYGADFSGYHRPCYCDACFSRFLRSRGPAGELPPPRERAKSLSESELAQAYWDFQAGHVEQHARACREALHAINPKIRIGVLHLDWESPMHHGVARGFGTEQLPVMCLTERTYSSGYDGYVAKAQQRFRDIAAHVEILAGVWHSRFPSENLAEHYYHLAKDTLGYWIYTMQTFESPNYSPLPGSHESYWNAIKTADAELDKLAADPDYTTRLKVRPFETPVIPLTAHGFKAVDLTPYRPDAEPGDHPRLRKRNTLYFHAKAGDKIAFDVAFRQIGKYRDAGQFLLVQPDGTEMARGKISKQETPGVARATASQTGMHGLLINMGSNACEVTSCSHPYAVNAAGKRSGWLITKVPPLYFLRRDGAESVVLWFETEGAGEGVRATIETDTGEQVYRGSIIRPERIELKLSPEVRHITATFEKLPDSVMEDLKIGVEKGLYPFAATSLAGLLHKEP